jgi:hypothetical protein
MKKKSPMPRHDIARKGGKTTLKKYGSAHFKALAEKRWNKAKKK